MKKFLYTALMATTALTFAAGAHAEGKAAIHSDTTTNTDVSAGNATPDNSYAHGDVDVNDNSVSATSTTGTAPGTASATITRDNSANGVNVEAQSGVKDGDDDASTSASMSSDSSDEAQVAEDMQSKTGVMKTRAKGAMGMLNPSEIKEVQTNLKQAGYNVSTDGVWGPSTKKALKEYQKAKKLNVTGKYDDETRASFNASADNSNTQSDGNN